MQLSLRKDHVLSIFNKYIDLSIKQKPMGLKRIFLKLAIFFTLLSFKVFALRSKALNQ